MIGRDPEGVEAQAILAEPEQWAIALGGGFDSCVGDGGSGAEDERGKCGDWETCDQSIAAYPFDRGVIDFDAPVF